MYGSCLGWALSFLQFYFFLFGILALYGVHRSNVYSFSCIDEAYFKLALMNVLIRGLGKDVLYIEVY